MKTLLYLLLSVWLCLSACRTEPNPIAEPDPTGEVTDMGEPDGVALTQTISTQGGTLTTPDGRVRLSIPAGALDKPTAISIQPITNNTPNGVGQAYRFLPDGLQFKKPATLTLAYTESDVADSDPEALGIAYQRANRVWYAVPGKQMNPQKREISVPMPHFSDWSLFESFHLVSVSGGEGMFLDFGESMTLEVVEIAPLTGHTEEPLAIKTGGSGPKWSLIGEGTLRPGGYTATYTAPRTEPKQNPVTLSVELTFGNSPAKVILLRQVHIGRGYVKVKFLGKERVYNLGVYLNDDEPEYAAIVGGNATEMLSINFANGTEGNVLPFNNVSEAGKCRVVFAFNDGAQYDSGHHNCNGQDVYAVGQVVFETYKPGQYVKGKLSGNLIEYLPNCSVSGRPISAEFFVRAMK
ncbi:hypothetical protein F5984_02500 [Rudanella paleaurantiibacter]|uniref:ZU5 domain-containing protein n=1 Tax=Rudanella paleaurantiibacter TaxID=2614655 RepID=A0A7J5U4S8_9BACT|nr:hypothetical protein [Rudanella paleaurantiibacter]KAB7732839.1 hypothetical protein F5984_02500 [Rudanella paleaurantiibacter]